MLSLDNILKKILIENKEAIQQGNFYKLYYNALISTPDPMVIGKLTATLFECNIDPCKLSGWNAIPSFYLCRQNCRLIAIPEGVEVIGQQAFDSCEKLLDVALPNSLVDIRDRAFYHCRQLTRITIPKNVYKMGRRIFEGTPLHSLQYAGTVEDFKHTPWSKNLEWRLGSDIENVICVDGIVTLREPNIVI